MWLHDDALEAWLFTKTLQCCVGKVKFVFVTNVRHSDSKFKFKCHFNAAKVVALESKVCSVVLQGSMRFAMRSSRGIVQAMVWLPGIMSNFRPNLYNVFIGFLRSSNLG